MFSNKCPIVKCFQLNNRLLIPSQSFLLLRSELLLSYQYHHILFDKVQRAPATKGIVRIQVALTIPMSLLGREACSAKASMLPEFPLHSTTIESDRVIFEPCPFLLYWCEPELFAPAQCGSFVFLVIAGLYVK